jgi:hypothetical protein
MISDRLWRLRQPKDEHLGIVLNHDTSVFPVQLALCSKMNMGEDFDEFVRPAPVPPFEAGTGIYLKEVRTFAGNIFTGKDKDVRHWGRIDSLAFTALRNDYATLLLVGKLVGPSRF